ncbi:MAG: sugar ABC transporter substrate-binding protein [Eubacteriales bacterium]|nr:sugar ABC transporter substrate-binding protein [Eubacteriales bacterium]
MKKLVVWSLCLCMTASMAAGCGAASDTQEGSGASADTEAAAEDGNEEAASDLSFAFCTNTLNNTFQSSMDATFSSLCEEAGISYTCLDPDYDLNTQLSQLSDVANSGYDAVFIIPVDSAGITSGLAEIQAAGIPIFNVDTAVIDEDIESFVTQFVGTNAYMAGQLVGAQMAEDYPDGADIAVLDFPSNESCVDRVNGFMDGLGENADKFNIVAQQDGEAALDTSLSLAEDIIIANPDLEAFFCINDPSALGAAAAVKAANKTGSIGVYSIDASPDGKQALLDGEFSAVAAQVPIQIAEYAYDAAVKYLGGDTELGDKKVYLDSFLVTKDIAEETLTDWQ